MIRAVIFDLDGVIIDSEPLWRAVEMDVFARIGVPLTADECRETMGLRADEAVEYWYRRRPWADVERAAVVTELVDAMARAIRAEARPLPGVDALIARCRRLGLRRAIASSSPEVLIDAALARLGLEDAFEVRCSAERQPVGKPDPAIYLATAAALGVDPVECIAIEDSLNGVRSAQAAGMRCIAIPESPRPDLALADLVVASLDEIDDTALT